MAGPAMCEAVATHIRGICDRFRCCAGVDVEASVSQLALAVEQLHLAEGRIDTASLAGRTACVTLLSCIDLTATALKAPAASRKYRDEFTINYRALFPDRGARYYRVDIFEAGLQWTSTRWVNGERFDLSEEIVGIAEELQVAWAALSTSVAGWSAAGPEKDGKKLARAELRSALSAFDNAWAAFENMYIVSLIDIEVAARGLVLRAVEEERKLQELESSLQSGDGELEESLREQRLQLLSCISRLNSAANLRWKGREDRGAEVLEAALSTLKIKGSIERVDAVGDPLQRHVAHVLASGVKDSFESVRAYLREVPNCIDSVHPHLCNNAGLVAQLSSWTESWELSARYTEPAPLLHEVRDLLAAIQNARRFVPTLSSMCDECDVELFMVLPRLVWLWFLAEPAKHDLLRRLVPHLFDLEVEPPTFSQPLAGFAESFRCVNQRLAEALQIDGPGTRQRSWEALVARVVCGPGGSPATSSAAAAMAGHTPGATCTAGEAGSGGQARAAGFASARLDAGVESAVACFVHELERWSIELQRHSPEDWCQCSAVLVRCLARDGAQNSTSPRSGHKAPFCV